MQKTNKRKTKTNYNFLWFLIISLWWSRANSMWNMFRSSLEVLTPGILLKPLEINPMPMGSNGLQWAPMGSNGAPMGEIGENNLGDFLVCFLIYYCIFGVYGVYIIPKRLIKVPGHIAILFRWFLELRKFGQNLDP